MDFTHMNNFPEELSETAINKVREEFQSKTVRTTSPEMEKILYKPIRVLDHGFIRVIDYMGTDASIVQAARVSYGAGTRKIQEDRGLINYLMRHHHTTPFEMCEIKLHIKMPIFVARQWIRHRTASVNEYSARYSVLGNEFYIPEISQFAKQSDTNKQGKSDQLLEENHAEKVLKILKQSFHDTYDKYLHMLNDLSLTRELARTVLPTSIYTEIYWKIDLHNLMHFLRLRADSHAQYEIRCYADAILKILEKWLPFTYEAFINYRKEATSLSKKCKELIKRMLKGEKITLENSELSKGEWLEFAAIFDVKD
ncbi:MAG: FAD-dependent thymidylate synthase [Holosporaceae bacterium]|jgi:thymidylate synthase (FAD)|nr:FAD-dependent thymidylate synthase [Holosporaceae bacterium]